MKKALTLILLTTALSANTGKAQYQKTIQSDRPGQAIGPFTVGKNVFQSQTGIDLGGFNDKSLSLSNLNIIPNTVLRYGLTHYFELNTAWTYRADRYDLSDSIYSTNGLSLSAIGTRFNITEGRGNMPTVAIQVSFALPILSKEYNPRFIAPSVMLIASKSIGDKFSFLSNLGINYDGNSAQPTGVYVANFGYSISDKFSTFIEGYGSFGTNSFEAKWDTGLAWLANDDLQFDIYGGMSSNNGVTDFFTSIGVSYRVIAFRNISNHMP